jgi:RimJ/RimL family protein N-acetyltransferase
METLKHCTIEVLEKKQLDFWWELKNDACAKRNYWGNVLRVYSKRELEKEIEKQLKSKDARKEYHYLVKNKRKAYVGYVGINRHFWAEPSQNAGITVIPRKPQHLRSKSLSEAVDWVLDKCFLGLRLHTVCAQPLEFNKSYIKFLEKKGFQRQGVMRRVTQIDGKFYGCVVMDIIDREWRKHAPQS